MIYACIKDAVIRNVIEASEEFIALYAQQGGYDSYVLLENGFGIGDTYLAEEKLFVKKTETGNELNDLRKENENLQLALAEMSILAAQQSAENKSTQEAIAELSILLATAPK